MKKLISLLLVAMLVLTVVPAFAATDSIADIVDQFASDDPAEFTILKAALEEADLLGALDSDTATYTVFAPTDAAFADLLTALEIEAADLLGHPQLAEVLLYHVVSSVAAKSDDIADGQEIETMQGEKITVAKNGDVMINDATVVIADVEAANGIIHVIDKVLVPESFVLNPPTQSIVEIALGNENFSILVAALQKAELVGALSEDGPFTVFAPTNDAFAALLEALDITAEELLAQPDLANVLLYHVVEVKVMSGALTDGMEAETLNGEKLTFDLSDPEAPKVNESGIIMADLEATNGVIHVIDTVLVPTNFELVEIEDDEDEVPQTGDNRIYPIAILLLLGAAALGLSRTPAKQKQ